ncbi:hypothetical protein ACFFX0_08205 [Citricoccus parietis]|uniref:Uncharacterized protein n=1 Tax=Citricoccus parietis TaxID=592307 RepID=A0ABV5FWV8_9MICC
MRGWSPRCCQSEGCCPAGRCRPGRDVLRYRSPGGRAARCADRRAGGSPAAVRG